MKRSLMTMSLLGLTVFALATSAFLGVFTSTYKVKADSNLGKAKCGVCHMSAKGGKLNAYGKDIDAAMKKADSKKMTAAILKSVEGLDSDKDGTNNGAEIKKDSLPGS
ncbi:MAG: hypothetical protein K8R88_09110 [Armatimonadetes bacterium]|nr:hypothetical protein [Armatimonadota bacterium]